MAGKRERIYLSSPHMSEQGYEQGYVKEAFDTNWVAPLGTNVDAFEKELSEMVGAKDAAALSSGTAAIHLALKAAEVGAGDIVFCPSLTFAASANPITYVGAIPIFIDSDLETWNMSPIALKNAFQKYPNVKAVIVVHLYGLCANIKEIMKICREYDTIVIEDAAESLGSTYHGKWTGTFGDYGVYSFNGNKIITTSGGGMLVCNLEDKEEAKERVEKVRFWATQAREKARHYEHEEIGFNYRMSNVLAGIGRGQLKILKDRVEKKRFIYEYYKKALKNIEAISFMPMLEGTYSNCWLTCALLDETKTHVTPEQIMDALAEENVESRPIWKPMHMQPVFRELCIEYEMDNLVIADDTERIDNSVGEKLFKQGICLPSDTKIDEKDLLKISQIILKLWE